MPDLDSAREFWDKEIVEQSHTAWMAHPLVRAYINRSIDPARPCWPMEWFIALTGRRRFQRALSVGCGGGAMERDLVVKSVCDSVDAFDASVHSLVLARRAVEREEMGGRIRYFAADFNEPLFLPRRTYDLVVFHQSMHHVAKLEKVLRAVLRSLRPGGLLYVDEYVGPSRHQWDQNAALLAPHQEAYQRIPREQRAADALLAPIQADDPSEAFRSGDILEQLDVGFRTLARRDYGGTLLSVLFASIPPPTDDLVSQLIAAEEQLLRSGAPSYYTLLVAEPKRGAAKWLASMNYLLLPKLKRLAREIRARLPRRRR